MTWFIAVLTLMFLLAGCAGVYRPMPPDAKSTTNFAGRPLDLGVQVGDAGEGEGAQ